MTGHPSRPDPYALLPPAYHTRPDYVVTFGPEVAALCSQVGLTPDPEQRLILDDVFGVGDDGLPAAFEYGIIGPRQQLKTGTLKMCVLGWLWVLDVQDVSWSAHLLATSQAAFQDIVAMVRAAPVLRKRLATGRTGGVFTGRNDMRLELRDGRGVRFSARTEDGGRGLTGSRVILDEALKLTGGMLGALLPTLLAMENAQAVYASTAAKDDGATLRTKRDTGRAGLDASLGWAEWGAPPTTCQAEDCQHWPPGHPAFVQGCALDDEAIWWRCMPLLGRRRPNGTGLTVRRVRELRKSMPPAEFARELYGWWGDPAAVAVFGEGNWEAAAASHEDPETGAAVPGFPTPPDFPLEALGVAVAADLSAAAIVGAGRRGERKAVRVIATGAGYEWLPARVAQIRESWPRAVVVVDPGGPAGILTAAANGVKASPLGKATKPLRRLHLATFDQWKAACGDFWSEIRARTTEHGDQVELNTSAAGAVQRKVVDRWVWERYGYDASVIEAATLAAWGVDNAGSASAYEGGRGVSTV